MDEPTLKLAFSHLSDVLGFIQRHDTDYEARYGFVLQAVAFAHALGFQAGFRIDEDEPCWPVAFIELPTGQVSWHMPQHPKEWDGHDLDTKFERIRAWRDTVGV